MQSQPNEKKTRRLPTGITERHSRICRSNDGGACNCVPSLRAWVFDRRVEIRDADGNVVGHGAKVWQTFAGRGALAAAKRWRANSTTMVDNGKSIAPTKLTLRDAAEVWLAGAKAEPPTILTRGGRPYKPSALRDVESNLRLHVLDDYGSHRLSDIRRSDLQALVDRLLGKGLSGSKVRNVIVSLRVVYRWAIKRDLVSVNPTSLLDLPNGHTPRERTASVTEAAELITALPAEHQPLWACAFFAGLRRGELQALKWSDISLEERLIHVRRSWDRVAGEVGPKSAAGDRVVPIVAPLLAQLTALKETTGRDGEQFVFGKHGDRPFVPASVTERAANAWKAANEKRAEKELPPLEPIILHSCRHSFSTWLDHADVSDARADRYMGHARHTVQSRYRHLRPEQIDADRTKLDAYLAGTGNVVPIRAARDTHHVDAAKVG